MADLSDTIEARAATPLSAAVDGQSATDRPIGELIQADIFLANKAARRKRRFGVRYAKFLPSGALSDGGRTASGFDGSPIGGG